MKRKLQHSFNFLGLHVFKKYLLYFYIINESQSAKAEKWETERQGNRYAQDLETFFSFSYS